MAGYFDPYAVLGVLPDAEGVVITAAYRALAQRYHPDKFTVDQEEAHERMSALNNAYAQVGTPERRAEYDRSRKKSGQASFSDSDTDEFNQAFDTALNKLEERWRIACSVYEDLVTMRARLHRISAALAFSFVTVILETRVFTNRSKLAEAMESNFLSRYFGSNTQVIDYARKLIFANERAAARALNQVVDVLGSDTSSERIISRIDADFQLSDRWKRNNQRAAAKARREAFITELRVYKDFRSARNLCEAFGYIVTEIGQGFFKPICIQIQPPQQELLTFEMKEAFIKWVLDALCAEQQ